MILELMLMLMLATASVETQPNDVCSVIEILGEPSDSYYYSLNGKWNLVSEEIDGHPVWKRTNWWSIFHHEGKWKIGNPGYASEAGAVTIETAASPLDESLSWLYFNDDYEMIPFPETFTIECANLMPDAPAQTGEVDVTNPGGSVVCTETDFTPTFTYTPRNTPTKDAAIENVKVEIQLGDTADAACNKEKDALTKGSANTIASFGTVLFTACGGSLRIGTTDTTKIEYKIDATIKVSETVRSIIREYSYKASVECSIVRTVDAVTGAQTFKITRAGVVPSEQTAVTNTITFGVEINYYTAAARTTNTEKSASFTPKISENLFIRVEETTPSTVFKFVVNECYFAHNPVQKKSDGNGGLIDIKDTFFENQCPVDKDAATNSFTDRISYTDPNFDMTVKSFFFSGHEDVLIHLYCQIFICLTATSGAACTQKTSADCGMISRKRRSSEEKPTGIIETRVVDSKQIVLLDKNDIIVPSCGADFIYDRITRTCSNKNIIDIKGVSLDEPWNADYANKSSIAYKNFVIDKAYQLYALTQMTAAKDHIVGLEVIDAEKKGSVVLTVRMKYSAMSNADAAFEGFSRAIATVDRYRVSEFLNVRKEKTLEFVEVKAAKSTGDTQYMTLVIVIVVVILFALLVSVTAVWKIKSGRAAAPNSVNFDKQPQSHDNPTMVTVN